MKVQTTITLSDELLKAIVFLEKNFSSRSEFIETALWAYIKKKKKTRFGKKRFGNSEQIRR